MSYKKARSIKNATQKQLSIILLGTHGQSRGHKLIRYIKTRCAIFRDEYYPILSRDSHFLFTKFHLIRPHIFGVISVQIN